MDNASRKPVPFSVRLTPEQDASLRRAADREMITPSALVKRAIAREAARVLAAEAEG